MASRKQNIPKHIPRANPKTESEESDEDERTEISLEYQGAKVNGRIGRRHSMLLWALTYAIIVLSTAIVLSLIGSFLEKLGILQ